MKQSSILLILIMLSGVTTPVHKFNLKLQNNTPHKLFIQVAFGSQLGKNKTHINETHTPLNEIYRLNPGRSRLVSLKSSHYKTFVVAHATNKKTGENKFSRYLRALDPITAKNKKDTIIPFVFSTEQ